MSRSRFSKLVSVVITGIIAMSGLPSMVLADVINAPSYYSVQSNLDYEITTNITSSWINHESIDLVLTNTGSETIHNWYLTFNTPYNIENIWNGTIYETDGNGTYTITSNGWNQDIRTGESVIVGITFSSDTETELSVDPTWYLLNTQATVVDASQYTLAYTEYSAWETGFTGQLSLMPQVDCQHWELSIDSNREITAVSSAILMTEGDNSYAITHDENNMRLFAGTAYNFGILGVNTEDPLEFSDLELTVVDLAYHLTDDADVNGIPDYLEFISGGNIIDPTPTPTPVPTDTPTITSTEEPTGTPTTEPTGTETPTPTPIIDYEADQDLDGLPDYIEEQLGTDPLKADTDDDLLNDYIEVMTGYDPTNPDSDGNGITDGNEDCDGDGLTNIFELQIGREMVLEDTDGDNLKDGDEVNVYGTDPLVPDTDGDGIKDGDEVSIGKNPSDSSDGATRIPQTFTWTIINPEDAAITSVDVSISVANRIDRVVDVEDYYDVDVYSTGVYGRIGSPLNFECDEDFDTATVVIHYDESSLGDTLEEELGVLWFDEESGFYITQDQAVLDTANNTVTLVLEHFSTYVLVNLNKWNNPPISPIEPLSLSGSVRTVRYETVGVYYDAFPIYEQNEAGEWVDTGRFYGGTIAPERNERNAWNQYLSSHPNDVCIETVKVGYYTLFGGLRYTYTWLVSTNEYEDNDHDGVPDTLEVNGVYAVGQGDDLYTSHVDEESGADSDGDLVPDLEEYRAIYIISKSSEDGSVSVTRISSNGQEILDSDSGFYNLAISYVDSILDPGETFAFCTPRSNPDDPDSDDDSYNDSFDLYPIMEAYNYAEYIQVNDIYTDIYYVTDYLEIMQADMDSEYAVDVPSDSDYDICAYLNLIAEMPETVMPSASLVMQHCLDRTGTMYIIDMYQLISVPDETGTTELANYLYRSYMTGNLFTIETQSRVATYYYYQNLLDLLLHSQSVLQDGESMTVMRVPSENEHFTAYQVDNLPGALELDWFFTLGGGGSSAGIVATVSREGDIYSITYRYCLYDTYDWTIESRVLPILPQDIEIHGLHRAGLAREFNIFGTFTNQFDIDVSDNTSLSFIMDELL